MGAVAPERDFEAHGDLSYLLNTDNGFDYCSDLRPLSYLIAVVGNLVLSKTCSSSKSHGAATR